MKRSPSSCRLQAHPRWYTKDRVKVARGDLQAELVEDFFDGFAASRGRQFHAKVLYGRSNHHKLEATQVLGTRDEIRCSVNARLKDQLPSTKGLLGSHLDYGGGTFGLCKTFSMNRATYEMVKGICRRGLGKRAAGKLLLPGVGGHFGQCCFSR